MMTLDPAFVADFDNTRARFEAWWAIDLHDRPPVVMKSKRAKPRWSLRPMPALESIDAKRVYLDSEYMIDAIENSLATYDYWGDMIPTFARGVNTAYLGVFADAETRYEPDTIWIDPTITDWESAPEPRFDTSLPVFKQMAAVSEAMAANARGRYMLQQPDHLDAASTVMQLRGLHNTMFDLIENPEAFSGYCAKLTKVWKQSYDWWMDHDRKLGFPGVIGWHQLFSSGRDGLIQCDFTALISPAMFAQFARPEMAEVAEHLGRSVYHMDGVGQIPHLDQLLDIPHLTAIQWQPGDGKPRCSHWPEMLQKIQAAGKGLQLFCGTDDIVPLTEFLSPKGVMLFFIDDVQPEEAHWVLRTLEEWGRKGA